MPAKTILSPAQRAAIFDPPADHATIERLYTLGPDDLVQVVRRRRGPNRIGHAVQLCYLRHPGRALVAGEAVPDAMLDLLAGQIGCNATDFASYAARPTTLREHRAEIEAWLGLRAFEGADVRSMLAVGSEIAASTDRGETIVAGMVDRLRLGRIVLPAASTLERLALIVRTRARKAAHAGLIQNCPAEQEAALDRLIASDDDGRTRLGWIREWPEAPSAANLKGIVERLDAVRAIGIAADGARRIHAARYAVIARTAGLVTAQHLRRLERPRRLAMLVASMIEMEAALTDAALVMVEKMVGALFRRADRTRSDRLLGQARMLKETARFHARLGRLLVDARATGHDPFRTIDDRVGWDRLESSIRVAEDLTRSTDDGLEDVVERYPAVRRFAPTFLTAFNFRTARSGDPLLGAIEALRTMHRDGRSVLPKRVPTSFIRPRWRKVVQPVEGTIDRRAYEIAVIVHLRERLASGSIWVDGSRAYRTLDDYLLPVPAFETMRADGDLRLAAAPGFARWHEERRTLLARRMTEVERAAAAGGLVDVTIERGQLLISPIRRSPSDEAEALKSRLYAMLPRVRITDLLVEVAAWSGFADCFVHARSGVPASDPSALMGAILADATNLGLGRMAESSRGLTLPRLRWTAEWHVRDE
ncbi:Tn3 family transposase, partial [Bacillus thuringiensis]